MLRREFLASASATLGAVSIAGCNKGVDRTGCLCGSPAAQPARHSGGDADRIEPSAQYPLRRPGRSQRQLQTAGGVPFFLLGDTAWSIAVSASRGDVVKYLDNRKAKGFNAFTFNAIEAEFCGGNGNAAPCNWYRDPPFTDLRDFTTPCEAYWEHVDYIVDEASLRGMLCVIFPAYEGYLGGAQGWYAQMADQGSGKLHRYGAWLGERYFAYDNILWVAGGDNDAADKSLTRAVVEGIRSKSNKWLFAWHGARNVSALSFWAGDLDWLDLNTIYDSASRAAGNAAAAYSNRTVRPFARIEDTYENPIVGAVSPTLIRWLVWDSVLQGGTGAIYGDVAVWRFNGPGVVPDPTSWTAAMERPAGISMRYLRALFESVAWTTLVPDYASRKWMTDGWSRSCLAALAGGGSFGVVYAPDASKGFTLDTTRLSGPRVTTRWYDPTSGAFVAAGTDQASGSRTFVRREANAEGSPDWVLLLESMG